MAIDPGWGWLATGLMLAIAEMIMPGVFLIWLGLAALATGAAAMLLPLPVAEQLALFAVVAVAAVLAGRHFAARSPIISDDPLLNERTARLIGRVVPVVEPIVHGEGRVRVGDGEWNAAGPDAAVGMRVRIVGAEGGRLVVELVEALPGIAP